MTLIASIITFSKKKNVTLDPRHGTLALDMEPLTLDKKIDSGDTNRLLLTCFWSARFAHNLGMNFIYKGIAVLESKFHFEIKDWDFLTASSHLK